MKSIYTIKQKNKSLGLCHEDKHYVVGFKNVITARSVQYFLHPEAKLSMEKNPLQAPNGLLFIPKHIGSPSDPMNDGGFHMEQLSFEEFIGYPSHMVGIVMPVGLMEEDEQKFIFESYIVDPFFDPYLFRMH